MCWVPTERRVKQTLMVILLVSRWRIQTQLRRFPVSPTRSGSKRVPLLPFYRVKQVAPKRPSQQAWSVHSSYAFFLYLSTASVAAYKHFANLRDSKEAAKTPPYRNPTHRNTQRSLKPRILQKQPEPLPLMSKPLFNKHWFVFYSTPRYPLLTH